ncbi:9892_t:CDS:1, partial [Scutellospora calospora]
ASSFIYIKVKAFLTDVKARASNRGGGFTIMGRKKAKALRVIP